MKKLTVAFAGGEIAPEHYARIDDPAHQAGLALTQNFVVRPGGALWFLPGSRLVREVKDSSRKVRLIDYYVAADESIVVLEFGHQYIRFHTAGGTILSGGSPYEISSPYNEADLFALRYAQDEATLTITHPSYEPRQLVRSSATSWTLSVLPFGSTLAPPTGLAATLFSVTAPTYPHNQDYTVTAVTADGTDESAPSSMITPTANNLDEDPFNYNDLSWTGSAGASYYNIYSSKYGGSSYGLIGYSTTTSFRDDNIAPDVAKAPPSGASSFSGAGNYPAACGYFEQRRWLAGGTNRPQYFWASQTGTSSNFQYSVPVRSDQRIEARIRDRDAGKVQHIVAVEDLFILTTKGEFRIAAADGNGLSPSNLRVRPRSRIGSSETTPAALDTRIIFEANRGGHLYDFGYTVDANGNAISQSKDLCLRAPHLFDGLRVRQLAAIKSPFPIVLAVSDSGTLLHLSYLPDQRLEAWTRRVTDGEIESVAVAQEGSYDSVYIAVKRTIGGATKRFVEYIQMQRAETIADAFHVDCGQTYSGSPATTITGLSHLEGREVVALADGGVVSGLTVSGGQVTLPAAASKVHVGLPMTGQLDTLPFAAQIDGAYGTARNKKLQKVWLRIHGASGVFAGSDASNLFTFRRRSTEPYGSPPALRNENVEIPVSGRYGEDGGTAVIRHNEPLPLEILSMTLEVDIGG